MNWGKQSVLTIFDRRYYGIDPYQVFSGSGPHRARGGRGSRGGRERSGGGPDGGVTTEKEGPHGAE